jgi:hypothetical protein
LLTAAVTTTRRQWRCAEIAAVISIKCNNRPPIKLPKVLVSLGSTISVDTVYDSDAFFDFMSLNNVRNLGVWFIGLAKWFN